MKFTEQGTASDECIYENQHIPFMCAQMTSVDHLGEEHPETFSLLSHLSIFYPKSTTPAIDHEIPGHSHPK